MEFRDDKGVYSVRVAMLFIKNGMITDTPMSLSGESYVKTHLCTAHFFIARNQPYAKLSEYLL